MEALLMTEHGKPGGGRVWKITWYRSGVCQTLWGQSIEDLVVAVHSIKDDEVDHMVVEHA